MQVPTQVFWVIYFSLVLFLLLLGETYLGLYVMGALTLYLYLFLPVRSHQPNHPWYKISVGVSSMLLVWLGISSIFSISLPLSQQAVFEWIFLINLFFWFLEVPWDDLNRRYWLLGMLLVGLVMVVLGLASLALPQFSYLIPGMNLIYPTYGHNHLGVVLLMITPMFWAAAQEWPSPFTRILAIIFNLSPLITFGRTIILLAAAQVFTVHRSMLRRNSLIWNIVRGIGVILVALLVAQFLMGWYVDQTNHCPVFRYQNIICKSWQEERRYWYYQQALAGLKEYSWVGSGPGTFALISEKYRQLPSYATSFVHNDFLQFFVELGIAGGLLVCFALCLPLVALYGYSKKNEAQDPLFQGIYWGLVFGLFNSLFDFDLNFIGVITIQVMGLAILSRWWPVKPWPTRLTFFDVLVQWWRRWFHTAATVVVVAICVIYAVTNLLLDYNKLEIVLKAYPFFHWHSKIFYDHLDEATPEFRQQFQKIYWHHSSLLTLNKENVAVSREQVELFSHLFMINPWLRLNKETYSYHINQGNLRQAEYEILAAHSFFSPKFKVGFQREMIPTATKESLAQALMWLSDIQFQQGRFAEGVVSMAGAQQYVDWIFNDSPYCDSLPLLYRDLGDDFLVTTEPLRAIPEAFFGQCRGSFAQLYLRVYQEKLKKSSCGDDCKILLQKALLLDPYGSDSFWNSIFPIHMQQLTTELNKLDIEQAVLVWRESIDVMKVAVEARNTNQVGQDDGFEEQERMLELARIIEPKLSNLSPDAQQTTREMIKDDVRWLYLNLER